MVAATAETAKPAAKPAGSPFAAVQNEEQLFALLKAGTSSGTVGAGHAWGWRGGAAIGRAAAATPPLVTRLPSATPLPPTAQVPERVMAAFHELYGNYKAAVLKGGSPGADEDFVARVMASVRCVLCVCVGGASAGLPWTAAAGDKRCPRACAAGWLGCQALVARPTLPSRPPPHPCLPPQVCERVLLELNPASAYTFPSYHTRLLQPYDYYAFGQRYIRCVCGSMGGGCAA